MLNYLTLNYPVITAVQTAQDIFATVLKSKVLVLFYQAGTCLAQVITCTYLRRQFTNQTCHH